MKTEHTIDRGTHRFEIDGLNVWIFQDHDQWIAHGIDIDYVVAAETREQAEALFTVGLIMSVIENVRRFGSAERFISKRAPREIENAWLEARQGLSDRTVPLQVPQSELGAPQERFGVPPQLHYYSAVA